MAKHVLDEFRAISPRCRIPDLGRPLPCCRPRPDSGAFLGHEAEQHNSDAYYPMLAKALGVMQFISTMSRRLQLRLAMRIS